MKGSKFLHANQTEEILRKKPQDLLFSSLGSSKSRDIKLVFADDSIDLWLTLHPFFELNLKFFFGGFLYKNKIELDVDLDG